MTSRSFRLGLGLLVGFVAAPLGCSNSGEGTVQVTGGKGAPGEANPGTGTAPGKSARNEPKAMVPGGKMP